MRTFYFLLAAVVVAAIFFISCFFKVDQLETVKKYANEYRIPEDTLSAIIKAESNFNKDAISPKGAAGMMQVMPKTAKWITEISGYDKEYSLFNEEDNIEIGCIYYKYLEKKFGNDLEVILAAYNAGESRIKNGKWKEFGETKEYVKKVKVYKIFYKGIYFVVNFVDIFRQTS